jgi:hypothetical protein
VRGLRLRGADLEGEGLQGNEAGQLGQDGENAFPVKRIRVRDEDGRDIPGELFESGEGGRDGRENVAPRRDPDAVGQARKGRGALDGTKKRIGLQVTEIEFPFERTEDVRRERFRGDSRSRCEPAESDSVLETDEDISEVDEEGAQRFGLSGSSELSGQQVGVARPEIRHRRVAERARPVRSVHEDAQAPGSARRRSRRGEVVVEDVVELVE